jgi:PAS domain-containing protein
VPVGSCIARERGLILEANLTCAELLGLARSERVGGAPFWAHLRAATAPDARGQPVYRLALGDVSEHKKLELALQDRSVELERLCQVPIGPTGPIRTTLPA